MVYLELRKRDFVTACMGHPEDIVHRVMQKLQILAQHRIFLKVTLGTTICLILKIAEY